MISNSDDFSSSLLYFDEVDYGKLEKLNKAMDALKKRYSMDSVMRAITIGFVPIGNCHGAGNQI